MTHELEDILFSIEKPEVKQLLECSNVLINEVLRYGVYIMNLIVEDNFVRKGVVEKVLVSFLRESLEIVDGIGVLLKNSCVVASAPLIRKLFELYIQIKYLTDDRKNKRQ